jgi:predicted nucleic acid-binding protein
MGSDLLLDTNIIIYLSKKELILEDFAKSTDRLFISVITLMEVKGFPFKSRQEESFIEKICDQLITIYIDEPIAGKVIELRKKKKIKLPDAIIQATAIIHNQTLLTRNVSDFFTDDPLFQMVNPFLQKKQ